MCVIAPALVLTTVSSVSVDVALSAAVVVVVVVVDVVPAALDPPSSVALNLFRSNTRFDELALFDRCV